MRRTRRHPWALAALILTGALVGCSSGGVKPAQTPAGSGASRTIQVRVSGSQVQTAERRVKVRIGTQVRLEVTADRADEVHLHGYDRKVQLQPNRQGVLEFRADVPGVFEVELEEAGLKLLEIEVA